MTKIKVYLKHARDRMAVRLWIGYFYAENNILPGSGLLRWTVDMICSDSYTGWIK